MLRTDDQGRGNTLGKCLSKKKNQSKILPKKFVNIAAASLRWILDSLLSIVE